VILSAALFKNYLTLLVVATYVIAPLPNWICGRASNPDDFMESSGSGVIDLGRFLTGFFVVMGIGTYTLTPSDLFPFDAPHEPRICSMRMEGEMAHEDGHERDT
jgi:hypothetical protein